MKSNDYMYRAFFILILCAVALPVMASEVVFPKPEVVHDYIKIYSPTESKIFYSHLHNFPHTYQLVVTKEIAPYKLSLETLIPNKDDVETNRSILVVKEELRGVSETARLRAKDSDWVITRDYLAADTYKSSGQYETELEAGVYLIEVSTPENAGPYALVFGEQKVRNVFNYFSVVSDIYKVKQWYGKSKISIIESPLVSIPILFIIGFLVCRWYRKKYA